MRDKKADDMLRAKVLPVWRFVTLLPAIADSVMLLFSIAIAFRLRFDDLPWNTVYARYIEHHLLSLPVVLAAYLGVFWAFRLYRCAWRHAGLELLWGVVYSNTIAIVCLMAIQRLIDGGTFPRSVLFMMWMSGIVSVGGIRVLLRTLCDYRQRRRSGQQIMGNDSTVKRVVILGGGANGVRVLRAAREDPVLRYNVVGFLDDDPHKWGVYVSNVKVLGPLNLLKLLLAERTVDEVIVAIADTGCPRVWESVMLCRRHKLPVKVVPEFRDLIAGKAALQLVDFSVEDLLRRPSACLGIEEIGGYLTGKRVLVTGAGGSIGSELCRQIASLGPDSLVLVGHGENSIHQIHQELLSLYDDMSGRIHHAIVSVSQEARIRQVIDHYRPQIVFHAAAHKHVPMMETNEQEAVQNNVLGTYYVSEACGWQGVERFVLVSTDKAADPCSIMGATKWLCEETVQAQSVRWPGTDYITVRFGNVLGSRGSIIPMFCEQIKRGGPVTVTHPEMTRFFMTIPEAVRLVLQAGSVGRTGGFYVLDMGEQVKVLDVAKDTILMHGLEPGVDVPIEYTGVRPGEKMHERLVSEAEQIERTPWEGLMAVTRPKYYTPDELLDVLASFEDIANHGSSGDVRRLLSKSVKGMCAPHEVEDEMSRREAA